MSYQRLQLHDKNWGKRKRKRKRKTHDTQPTKIIYKKAKKKLSLFRPKNWGNVFVFSTQNFTTFGYNMFLLVPQKKSPNSQQQKNLTTKEEEEKKKKKP